MFDGPRHPARGFIALPGPFHAALLACLAWCLVGCLLGCKGSPVLEAERMAPVGSEFIRLYGDGHAEYGFAVVKENLKAQGGYRYAQDTVWFLADSFKEHFPAGYLPVKEGVLYMENGLHFKIKKNTLK
ncbi:MAG: hypothetical protein ABIY63_07450 [Fibrobacteria bacterium]